MSLTDAERRQLDEVGFVTLPGFMSGELLERLHRRVGELFVEEGDAAGGEFKQEPGCLRLANLMNKGAVFCDIVTRPFPWVRHVLGEEIKLSSLNARQVPPDSGRQPLHADMAAIMDERGAWVCNTVWMLDDFTADNGALRVVPGSHHWRQLPKDALADPLADHPGQVLVTGRAGTVVVLNAHAWHAGTANCTDRPRTAVHSFYCRRDKRQQQYQKLLLDPRVQDALSADLRHLLALDDQLNDQLCAEGGTLSGFLK